VTDRPPRLRFAPSPTGYFHVGSGRSALFNWALAEQTGGTFILRIEDTDAERNRDEWTRGILEALAWLGIHQDDARFEGPYFQSSFAEQHRAAALKLYEQGDAYYCDCTREVIDARNRGTDRQGYDGHCRDLALEPAVGRALRFRVPRPGRSVVVDVIRGTPTFDHDAIEDFVILRGNGSPMFLLANVVDDMTMGVTHVVRGEEHLSNTPKQQLLWAALGQPVPPVWAHVPVLVNEKRQKLSKRRDKVAMEQYREEGFLADAMRNYLMTLGWSPSGDSEIVPWERVVAEFRLEDVVPSPAFFDVKKLTAFNGEYLRAMPIEEFIEACQPWLTGPDAPWAPERYDPEVFAAMAPLVQTRVTTLAEVPGYVDFLFLDEPPADDASWTKAMKDGAAELIGDVVVAFETPDWRADELKDALEQVGEKRGLKLSKAQAPVRVAVTGRTVGPPLFESLELLGRERTLGRLRAAYARL
jgi:glutamyl-tRNA synthetase